MSEDFLSRRQAHFDALYRANPDPWGYRTSRYEREKYEATLAALPAKRYRAAIEVGCSIGVLTEMIAGRADAVTGIDLSEHAIALARRRLAHRPDIHLIRGSVPADWPGGGWDLILLSEVLYYLSAAEIGDLARKTAASALPGAHCILVNWRGDTGTSWRGPEAAEEFLNRLAARACLADRMSLRKEMFTIDRVTLA
ncbi:class I SAM-dependent DNA methyltransferase [Paenirhodobacter populi]|uniref:Methyltransferase domain-containing protein n=1 Tax=Paenirhodobacter populi TaxID=2306993 RepID=A0A451GCX3_9RHOB|nr:class I SAM-dependent methyltransferase [Sinirhodobacter populi]RWR13314.1 methyltransferase domain-containing protein [Sinirhodobacter populi]